LAQLTGAGAFLCADDILLYFKRPARSFTERPEPTSAPSWSLCALFGVFAKRLGCFFPPCALSDISDSPPDSLLCHFATGLFFLSRKSYPFFLLSSFCCCLLFFTAVSTPQRRPFRVQTLLPLSSYSSAPGTNHLLMRIPQRG